MLLARTAPHHICSMVANKYPLSGNNFGAAGSRKSIKGQTVEVAEKYLLASSNLGVGSDGIVNC